MAGIDYSLARIDIREKFSLTKTRLEDAYACFCADPAICGAVLIATCNRTELYLSLQDGDGRDPFSLLCKALAVQPQKYTMVAPRPPGNGCFQASVITGLRCKITNLGRRPDNYPGKKRDCLCQGMPCGGQRTGSFVPYRNHSGEKD